MQNYGDDNFPKQKPTSLLPDIANPYPPFVQQPFFSQNNNNMGFYNPPPNYFDPRYARQTINTQEPEILFINETSITRKSNNLVERMLSEETKKKLYMIKEKLAAPKNLELKPKESASNETNLRITSVGHFQKNEILKLIWPCMIFQVLVTEKKEDRLIVVLKELLAFAYDGEDLPDDKYGYNDFKNDILKSPEAYGELKRIRSYQIEGRIKKYDVDEKNIMAYFVSFSSIKRGDELIAIVKRTEDSQISLSLKNIYISGCRQRKFEPYDPNKRHEHCFYRLGYLDLPKKDRTIQEIDPFFEKELNFANKNLFDITSPNYAEYHQGLKDLEIRDQNSTLDPCANTKVFTALKLDFKQIRNMQNKVWAIESLNQGIELTQHKLYEEALAFFDNAISMDETYTEAYVAKGCALSNMGKYHEGLKQLQIALDLEPENESAKKYYEAVMDKIREAEKDIFKIDDKTKVTLVRTKKIPEKNSYSNLILTESDDESSQSKKHKKKKSTYLFCLGKVKNY